MGTRTKRAGSLRSKGGYVLRVSNLHAVARLNNPKGTRIERLETAGAPAGGDRRYTVAAAGEQDVKQGENRPNCGTRAIDALREYFRRHSPVNAPLTHAKFIAV